MGTSIAAILCNKGTMVLGNTIIYPVVETEDKDCRVNPWVYPDNSVTQGTPCPL